MAGTPEEDLELSDFEDEDLDAAPEVVSSTLIDVPAEEPHTSSQNESPILDERPDLGFAQKPSETSNKAEQTAFVESSKSVANGKLLEGELGSESIHERKKKEELEVAVREERARAEEIEKQLKAMQSRQVNQYEETFASFPPKGKGQLNCAFALQESD